MQFDALTLAAVAEELRASIVGGRVQRIVQTGPLSIGLEIYAQRQRRYLLASAHPQFARVHLTSSKPSRGVEYTTPLILLLRKYVLGGFILAVEQPPLERIVVLSIAKEPPSRNSAPDDLPADELPDDELPAEPLALVERADLLRAELIIEPQDRRSNIMLVDDNNLVLDSVKRVTPRMSQRVILPRVVYEVPPPQREKRDPRTATAAGIEALREGRERDLARALVANYRAVSPQVAREVVWRALGREAVALSEELPWFSIAARLRELWSAPAEPSLLLDASGEPLVFAPYQQMRHPEAVAHASMSTALELFYAPRESLTAHSQRRTALAQRLMSARERIARLHRQLSDELTKANELEHLRWEGEMIFAYLHTLAPRQDRLVVEGEVIALDPLRSPVDEAQQRFKAYDKAKSALAGLPERLRKVEAQLAGLEQLQVLLELADSYEQIEVLAAEAEEQGYVQPDAQAQRQKRSSRAARPKPLHLVSSDGFDIYVGRSSNQNNEVTFRIGRPDDWWLHVRGIPGSHVIVRVEGREVPERTLVEAAGLAAYFSKLREEAAVEVELARRSVVRRIPGAPPGLVTYRAERTLRVPPRAP